MLGIGSLSKWFAVTPKICNVFKDCVEYTDFSYTKLICAFRMREILTCTNLLKRFSHLFDQLDLQNTTSLALDFWFLSYSYCLSNYVHFVFLYSVSSINLVHILDHIYMPLVFLSNKIICMSITHSPPEC